MEIWVGLIVFGFLLWFIVAGFKNIPDPPVHIGAIKWLGRVTGKVRGSGLTWIIPFFESIENVSLHRRDLKPPGKNYTSKDLGEVEITYLCGWTPDPDRINEFFTVGQDKGVIEKLSTRFEQEIQQTTNTKSHEKIFGFTDKMEKRMIANVTGIPEEGVDEYMKNHSAEGVPDQLGWGIRIYNVSISSPQPKGELAKVIARESVEKRERKAEAIEIGTEAMQADRLVKAAEKHGQKMSFKDALNIIKDHKTMGEGHGGVYRIPGLTEVASKVLGDRK